MLPKSKNIIILTGPVSSGKTTLLQEFVRGKNNCGGFITPDRNGNRILINVSTGEVILFETKNTTNEIVTIGRFHFLQSGFDYAGKLMFEKNFSPYFIIDEVGRLEVNLHKGLEPNLTAFITEYKTLLRKGKLILIIRDSLLNKAIEKYNLEDARIISVKEFKHIYLS